MAIIKSAKKAIRSSARKRVFNLRRKKALGDSVKAFRANPSPATLSTLYQAIDKAAKRGIIKKNNAARKKSRFTKLLQKTA
ncbi:MAG: 30S ribosomal protein S20 [Candidatus Vogelbacteria bacterium]|nr:30S ribosomal protein S20 [Candidatus Vogelbacteria bacterium]